jgi:hypothetical protein
MIQEILYIQNTHAHLSRDARSLINRDKKSLQGMNTSTITAYVYGAQMLTQLAQENKHELGQRSITTFFNHNHEDHHKKIHKMVKYQRIL